MRVPIWPKHPRVTSSREVGAHLASPAAQGGWICLESCNCVGHAGGWIEVVVVHVHDDVTLALRMKSVSLRPEFHFGIDSDVSHAFHAFKEVPDFICTVIHDQPLHARLIIGL